MSSKEPLLPRPGLRAAAGVARVGATPAVGAEGTAFAHASATANTRAATALTRAAVTVAALSPILAPLPLSAQVTTDPFAAPIQATEGRVVLDLVEFATLPDHPEGPARMMLLVDEPGTRRLFVNDMHGRLYTVGYDGRQVALYLDHDDPSFGVQVQSGGRERGFQSFALHPDFGRPGAPGYGRFYTWTDIVDNAGRADFTPGGGSNTHHTVLLEWRANDPSAPRYDGGAPRALMRFEQPFANHNAGHIAFDPSATPGSAGYGLLYVGSADGGSGGDPLNLAQDMGSAFGKILRIDPLGSSSASGRYGIPTSNPFVGRPGVLPEIYASGLRNPQRLGWDPANGNLFVADIGQNAVEEVSLVPPGGNLGWNVWEGSYRFVSREGVQPENPRSDPAFVYPVAEYDRFDPLVGPRVAVTGVEVFREDGIPSLRNRVLFADSPSGEIFHFDADRRPEGGNQGFRRILLREGGGEPRTFLEIIQAKNRQQEREPAERTDIRFGRGPDGRFFLLNKHDGVIREVVGGAEEGS